MRGPLVSEGYWKCPEETAETFRIGWLRIGDMARMDDEGFCYIVDRSNVIISGGFNVYPREVEDVLSQHPSVLSAAVIGIPDPKWGESVHAIVIHRAGANVDARELIGWVRDGQKGTAAALVGMWAPADCVGSRESVPRKARQGHDVLDDRPID